MNIPYTHESIRLVGRWDRTNASHAVTTTTGSYVEFAFEGRMALARFDVTSNALPHLHLWVQIDGGDRVEVPIDSHLRVIAATDGKHICRIIYKGGSEQSRRWYLPLMGKVSFIGVQTECPSSLTPDNRRTVEFVGDSITEGVLIDDDFNSGNDPLIATSDALRCYQDDVCATYAWLTAEALELRPVFMGYGAVGVTQAGQSDVPAAPDSYLFNFEGSPITHEPCDVIVINHGANDRGGSAEKYTREYARLLDVVRRRNPDATVVALSAFCGAYHEELGKMIEQYNAANGCKVHFIDSTGWIPLEPLHPLRDGHRKVAQHFIPLLREIIG